MVDKIIRSKRKTLSLHIDDSGGVIVRAPLLMPQLLIDRFVNRNTIWIKKHKNKVLRRLEEIPPRKFISGEKFYFLGEEYELEFRDNSNKSIVLEGNFITRPATAEEIKRRFRKWYRDEARFYLTERLNICAEHYKLPYKELKITSAAHRWGSCTSKGCVNFPWRIMMCPENIIAYVIAHEMAHLLQLNHSPRFWREVEKMCPSCQEDRKWLHANEHKFTGF
ncbi:MAG: SprT family zinc-dependent metalloprotease [Victivallaceae bacterium]|nr:SprT family zinc-dependent metalloprotease [Victivallaceae bacterium]